MVSNILSGDYLYLLTDNGIVTCLDPKTGEVKYEGGRLPKPARFMGSPVAFGGHVAHDERGGRHVHAEGRPGARDRADELDRRAGLSSPAIANGRIYIRGEKHLFAIGK